LQAKLPRLIFVSILIAFGFYAARFIEKTSFIIEGQKYYVLFDDAMISMRYAKNLAGGYGPVWNPGGERVEGYTNPLWLVYMAVWHLLPIPASKISLAIQISGAFFLFLNLIAIRILALEITRNEWLALGAVFLTAFFFSLNNWAIQGMEVGVLTLCVSLFTVCAVRNRDRGKFFPGLYILLGLTTLIRMDMAVPYLVITVWCAWFDQARRVRHLWWGCSILIVFLLGQSLWRVVYYGDWLPNTYYLKIGGIPLLTRLTIGFGALRQFVWNTGWVLFAIPFLAFPLGPNPNSYLLFGILLGQAAYSVYIGGDAWEHRGGANRFLAIAMPLFFTLLVQAANLIRLSLLAAIQNQRKTIEQLTQAGLAVFLLFSLFSFNIILTNDSVLKWTLQKRPIFVDGSERLTRIGLIVGEITSAGAQVAVVSAGSIIYFSERPGIDLYGKMDRVIARSEPRLPKGLSDYADLRPGHAKWDYSYSLGVLQPDVIAQLVDETLGEAQPWLVNYTRIVVEGFPLYVRNDSTNILWENIPQP